MRIAVFAGDGIGPEVTAEAVRVLEALQIDGLELVEGDVGGAAYRKHGHPLPAATLEIARSSDAILFGAVGDFSLDHLERALRPEQAVLGLRKELGLFANLRPATVFKGLEDLSTLRPEVAGKIDLLIVRELNGDVYFGEKGTRTLEDGRRQGWDMMSYAEDEVRR
ncbi:3-isopropylmalate dehydrogenase, partial [Sphingomonas sp. LH128]